VWKKSCVVSQSNTITSTMADPSDPSTNPCVNELQTAAACILADVENCVCMEDNFLEVFPTAVESSFREVLTTQNPADPNFCQATNDKLCEFLQVAGSCCCTREVIEYSACILVSSDSTNGEDYFIVNAKHLTNGISRLRLKTW
jgi:hypothetical protein